MNKISSNECPQSIDLAAKTPCLVSQATREHAWSVDGQEMRSNMKINDILIEATLIILQPACQE
ncbi:hypothetical protein GL2_26500 [Microbulbifer sp. GL-2]|nr:hypothetical protein GL2_26500 [Microbulbifer sp. GL-2]